LYLFCVHAPSHAALVCDVPAGSTLHFARSWLHLYFVCWHELAHAILDSVPPLVAEHVPLPTSHA
jgi:hypothetical protein